MLIILKTYVTMKINAHKSLLKKAKELDALRKTFTAFVLIVENDEYKKIFSSNFDEDYTR